MNTGVSYYNVGTTFKYNGWECDVETDFAGCGHTLWVNSSHQQSLGQPSVGDRILIYQSIKGHDQLLTHVVKCVGKSAYKFSSKFPKEQAAIMVLHRWPFTREMEVLAVLKPSAFGGRVLRRESNPMQLHAKRIEPNVLRVTSIVGPISQPPNGYVYPAPKAMLSERDLRDKLSKSGLYSISETW